MKKGLAERQKNMRFKIHIYLSLFTFILFLGCSGKDEKTAGKTVVSYWEKWTGFEADAMQAVVDDFNKSQNRIFVKMLSVSDIDQKMMLATAGGNPPDIAGLFSQNVNVFAGKGALTPLNSKIKKAGIKASDYIPIYWRICEFRDFIWALPSTPSSLALHWNKQLFEDAGLDLEKAPESLDELDRMAEKLTIVELDRNGGKTRVRFSDLTESERKSKNFEIIQLGFSPFVPGWWNAYWFYWFGGKHWDGKSKITANLPENIETFQWFKQYAEKYGVENLRSFGSSFGNFSSPQDPFLSGKVAMVLQGIWTYNFIEKYSPGMKWGAAAFPAKYPDKDGIVTLAESDVLVIPKGAKHPEEAFEFIKYVNSPSVMEKLCMGQRKFTPLTEVSDKFLKNHPNPYINLFIRLAKSPNAKSSPKISIMNEYVDELLFSADRVYSLKVPPAEALKNVQDRIQLKFDRIMDRWNIIKDRKMRQWSQDDQE